MGDTVKCLTTMLESGDHNGKGLFSKRQTETARTLAGVSMLRGSCRRRPCSTPNPCGGPAFHAALAQDAWKDKKAALHVRVTRVK